MVLKAKPAFVGCWVSFDEPFPSTVQYTVKKNKENYQVTAIDMHDDEKGEIYDVRINKRAGTLEFACYWPSSGRFTKCRFIQTDDDKIDLTFTYTDHDILVRKKK